MCLYSKAQRYSGTFLFNLVETDPPGHLITVQDIKSGKIKVLSDDTNSVIKYDSSYSALSFTTKGYTQKYFGIIYKSDTIVLIYPSYSANGSLFICIDPAIPLNGTSFCFYHPSEMDDILFDKHVKHKNLRVVSNNDEILSEKYRMKEETKNLLLKRLNKTIKFKE